MSSVCKLQTRALFFRQVLQVLCSKPVMKSVSRSRIPFLCRFFLLFVLYFTLRSSFHLLWDRKSISNVYIHTHICTYMYVYKFGFLFVWTVGWLWRSVGSCWFGVCSNSRALGFSKRDHGDCQNYCLFALQPTKYVSDILERSLEKKKKKELIIDIAQVVLWSKDEQSWCGAKTNICHFFNHTVITNKLYVFFFLYFGHLMLYCPSVLKMPWTSVEKSNIKSCHISQWSCTNFDRSFSRH